MSSPSAPRAVTHRRPVEGAASEIVGYEQIMAGVRLLGTGVVAALAPFYRLLHPVLVPLALVPVVLLVIGQRAAIREDAPLHRLRRLSIAGLVVDSLGVYLVGFAFLPDPAWNAYLFYPLMALEGSLIAGARGALASTGVSIVMYLVQMALHPVVGGGTVEAREAIVVVSMLTLLGGFIAAAGTLTARARTELRVMLDLSEALASQRSETDTIELLDRRLGDAIGGRVRSVALRQDDGSYEVVRWRTDERRMIPRAAIEMAIPEVDRFEAGFREGNAVTMLVERGGLLAQALGLPMEARAVTLVPVQAERRWIGILPVLWVTERPPTRQQLKLLHALADNAGVALAQGQLQKVREEAATDVLTGLVNRRSILQQLDESIARAKRSDARLAVLFCDLDGFKAVNDKHGHATGDRVLTEIAAAVRSSAREGDVVGRLGGDEFALIAAGTGAEDSRSLAERVRTAVRAVAAPHGVDVTIGIAAWPEDGASRKELLVAADEAMYRGKSAGRGRIVMAAGSAAAAGASPEVAAAR